MTRRNIEKITEQVCALAREAGGYLKSEINRIGPSEVETKGLHNFVTYVDKTSEEMLMKGLKEILPEAGFIAEESPGAVTGERYNWVIDPLDGTTNYIHHIPVYSVSIALMEKDSVISGVVYEPGRDECFYAWQGGGAFLNGKTIGVSRTVAVADGLFATGFPYADYSRMEPFLGIFRFLMENSHGLRRMGSAAVDLAYVACGRFEGFYEYNLNPWDVAAGAFIVERAGGKVSDFSAGKDFIFGKEIIAANGKIFSEFIALVKKYFA